jgi:ketosteroid isomerase-like protein
MRIAGFTPTLRRDMDSTMRWMKALSVLTVTLLFAGCASVGVRTPSRSAEAELAVLRQQFEDVHGSRDVAAFGALHTDETILEWRGRSTPAFGRVALEKSMREVWATRRELRLNLQVSDLRIHGDRAYEFGTYEETWIDPRGNRVTEFGRYVAAYAQEANGPWRIARLFGFSNLTATKRLSE